MKGTMIVDGRKIEFTDETNVLEVVRKAGIELPTFCYHSELSIYGGCRMCIVEDSGGKVFASCSQLPKDGMEIITHSSRLQKYRKTILELLLANHDRDCTACDKDELCKLKELSLRFGIKDLRFEGMTRNLPLDTSSLAIVKDMNKCILCGDCVRMCEEIQGVGAIDFAHRGSEAIITAAFGRKIGEVNCIDCGQCRAICPTGAIIIKNDNQQFWDAIHDENKRVVVQVAPAVRVALGEEFGLKPGESTVGKIVAALKTMGADEVYDTSFAADMTVMEEGDEFLEKFTSGEGLPLFTSCCPGWVKFAENRLPDMVDNISSCKSPQQMFGTVIKEYFKPIDAGDGKETVVVSVMPCTAKKAEAAREEFEEDNIRDVDIVITTEELAKLINETGIIFDQLDEESFDMPFGLASGSGVIFGTTGGVTEAVVTRLLEDKPTHQSKDVLFQDVRGLSNVKEASLDVGDNQVNIAVVHGLKNAEKLIEQIKSGEKAYHLIEVMACPGGCVAGGGQPVPVNKVVRQERASGLYSLDRTSHIKSSEENPLIVDLFEGLLKGKRDILHVRKKAKAYRD